MASTQALVTKPRTLPARGRQPRRAAPLTVTCSTSPLAPLPQEQQSVSRRDLGALVTALSVGAVCVSAPPPAQAFLGIGEDDATDYEKETASVLSGVKGILDLPRDAEGKEESVKELRKEINSWVAKYRRTTRYAGRPSYGNTYSVLNALAGHFNSFGPNAPIPKKRLDRIKKELDDAEKLLARGR